MVTTLVNKLKYNLFGINGRLIYFLKLAGLRNNLIKPLINFENSK